MSYDQLEHWHHIQRRIARHVVAGQRFCRNIPGTVVPCFLSLQFLLSIVCLISNCFLCGSFFFSPALSLPFPFLIFPPCFRFPVSLSMFLVSIYRFIPDYLTVEVITNIWDRAFSSGLINHSWSRPPVFICAW